MHSSFLRGGAAYAFSCILALLSCNKAPIPPAAAVSSITQNPTPAAAVTLPEATEDETLLTISKTLRAQKLLILPDQCYAYQFDPAPGKSTSFIDVRENHGHTECGGDPLTQPHLFTVHIDKLTRILSTDARSPGIFHPLQP